MKQEIYNIYISKNPTFLDTAFRYLGFGVPLKPHVTCGIVGKHETSQTHWPLELLVWPIANVGAAQVEGHCALSYVCTGIPCALVNILVFLQIFLFTSKWWIRPPGCSCSCSTAKLSICIVTQGTSSTERAVPAPTQGFLAGFPSTRPLPGLLGALGGEV